MTLVRNRILIGDIRDCLAELPSASIDCVITSPPYYQLRDYGVRDQLGLEPDIGGWVDELKLALNGLVRVLKPTGSLWLNLGDTYSRHAKYGAAPKSLMLAPERLLIAMADDGWIVRNKVIWAKTNPMPHSVDDRLSNSYDVIYFLTRSPHYFFDLDAIRLPHRSWSTSRRGTTYPPDQASSPLWRQRRGGNRGLAAQKARGEVGHPLGKNPGDVWQLPSASFRGAHFATFPPSLVEKPLLATCPELICTGCETPFKRISRSRRETIGRDRGPVRKEPRVLRYEHRYTVIRERGPLLPDCRCSAGAQPGVVLDPFFGAGTVGLVAERQGRDWVGIEINPQYAEIAQQRISDDRGQRAADGPPVDGTANAVAPTDQPSNPERGNEP
jgi:DNA modification methylase